MKPCLKRNGKRDKIMYPFRVRITDPELVNLLKALSKNRAVKISNVSLAIKAGQKLKPIRKDVFIGTDNRYYKSFISLPPELLLEVKPAYGKKKGFDFLFKPLF